VGVHTVFWILEQFKGVACTIVPANPMIIEVANGGQMVSDSECVGLVWNMQGHEWKKNCGFLSRNGYDIILGMDWLESLGSIFSSDSAVGEHPVAK